MLIIFQQTFCLLFLFKAFIKIWITPIILDFAQMTIFFPKPKGYPLTFTSIKADTIRIESIHTKTTAYQY